MKKDKKWLKNQIEIMGSETSDFYPHEQMVDREVVLNLINQLDEPEVLSQEWIDNNVVHIRGLGDIFEAETVENLLVPKQKLPVIPRFVADWIDAHDLHENNPLREYRDLEIDFNEGWTNEKDAAVYHWVNENPYAFIDALRYGYEIEKELKEVAE